MVKTGMIPAQPLEEKHKGSAAALVDKMVRRKIQAGSGEYFKGRHSVADRRAAAEPARSLLLNPNLCPLKHGMVAAVSTVSVSLVSSDACVTVVRP